LKPKKQVQFVGIFIHGLQLFFIECDYPIVFAWLLVGHGVIFFGLFSGFYWKSYIVKSDRLNMQIEKKSLPSTKNDHFEGGRSKQLFEILESNGVVLKNRPSHKKKMNKV